MNKSRYFAFLLILGFTGLFACGQNNGNSDKSLSSSDDSSKLSSELSSPSYSELKDAKFFDSNAKENGDGSYENPYKDLSEFKNIDFTKFRKVLFKCGSKFLSSLSVENLIGCLDNPYIISSYGEGNKPIFDGNNLQGNGVLYVRNCEYITISDLELTDSATSEGDRRGVELVADNNLNDKTIISYRNVKLDNLYIHNIRGYKDEENSGMAYASKRTGGIQFVSKDGLGRFVDLEISNCTIENVDNVGIASYYKVNKESASKVSPYDEKFLDVAHLNPHIHHNKIFNIGKNGVFLRNIYKGVFEYNVVHDTAVRCVSGNSIVTSYVDGTIIQYNEGYRNMAKARASDGKYQDGCMLDADLQSKDTIWQYNYSHDNSFGLFLNCTSFDEAKGVKDVAIVRYNLSLNDLGNKGIIYINYVSNGIYVYNNTIITNKNTQNILQSNSNTKSFFYNNIIYSRNKDAKVLMSGTYEFSHNCFYLEGGGDIFGVKNISASKNISPIYLDPCFAGNVPDESILGRDNVYDFLLSKSSPCINAGIDPMADKDYFGIATNKNIGFAANVE